jgi:hypothetical protein
MKPHIVTISLPNDKVYKFEAYLDAPCALVVPPREATIGFRPLPGTNAALTPVVPVSDREAQQLFGRRLLAGVSEHRRGRPSVELTDGLPLPLDNYIYSSFWFLHGESKPPEHQLYDVTSYRSYLYEASLLRCG